MGLFLLNDSKYFTIDENLLIFFPIQSPPLTLRTLKIPAFFSSANKRFWAILGVHRLRRHFKAV